MARNKIIRKLTFMQVGYTTRFIQYGCPTKIVDATKIHVGQYIIIDEGKRRKKELMKDNVGR